MKLDRNLHADGRGKYELRNLRTGKVVDDCGPGEEHEFFVLMLKDREFASEVFALADRAGPTSLFCQDPD